MAALLGLSTAGVYGLVRRNTISFIELPWSSKDDRKNKSRVRPKTLRFRLSDVQAFIMRHRFKARTYWNDDAAEWPIKVVMRLTGLAKETIKKYRTNGLLPDLSPESIAKLIEHRYRRQMINKIRPEIKAKYKETIRRKWGLLSYYRQRLKKTLCRRCGRKAMAEKPRVPAKPDVE